MHRLDHRGSLSKITYYYVTCRIRVISKLPFNFMLSSCRVRKLCQKLSTLLEGLGVGVCLAFILTIINHKLQSRSLTELVYVELEEQDQDEHH
jgi:hypothetical protein